MSSIQLDQFLKLQGVVGTGGQAKLLIRDGAVLVNGDIELRRGRKLFDNDVVEVHGQQYVVTMDDETLPGDAP